MKPLDPKAKTKDEQKKALIKMMKLVQQMDWSKVEINWADPRFKEAAKQHLRFKKFMEWK